MAELLFGLTENILIKLSSKVYEEVSSAYGVGADLKALEVTISTIKAVLDDEVEQIHNKQTSLWLDQLQNVLCDVDNMFDEFEYVAKRKKVQKEKRTNKKVCCSFPVHFNNSIVFNFKMAHRIKEITKRLDEIASRRQKFHITERDAKYFSHTIREMTHSYIHEYEAAQVIGRDKDKEIIIEFLTHSIHDKELSIISLVGMGGLGKTTLAKLAFNDQRINGYFEKKMWSCVSMDFDVQRLTREILDSARCSKTNGSSTMDQLQSQLREELIGKRFLLVLDDVWNESASKWRDLRQFLMVGAKGSKVLVTTRMDSIARVMGSDEKHVLKAISSEDSWFLFSKYAFVDGKEKEVREDLKRIGGEIVEKCKGVPLAITSLGSLLYSKTNTREWEYIRDSEMWELEDGEDGILPALKLSYTLMPSHLKPCFLYCTLFPKDYVYSYSEMIGLWMAQGMLSSKNENEELEDIGERYFKELCSRSFFQDFDVKHWDFKCTFKMHDLVHDLALSIVQDKYLSVESNCAKNDINENVQHLYFSKFDGCSWLPQPSERVRSIVFSKIHRFDCQILEKCIKRFKFLRVLELESSLGPVTSLPDSIGRLKHLRYLNLRNNILLQCLPNSICELYNLQTLILQRFGEKATKRHGEHEQ